MVYHHFMLNNLPADQLVQTLIDLKHCGNEQKLGFNPWYVCWLNNDGDPVIGILPRTAWLVYPLVNSSQQHNASNDINPSNTQSSQTVFSIYKSSFVNNKYTHDMYARTYQDWTHELIEYSKACHQSDVMTHNNSNTRASNNHYYYNGLMGFIGYDIAAHALSPDSTIQLANQPAAFMGHYDMYLTPSAQGWDLHVQPDTAPVAVGEVMDYLHKIEQLLASRSVDTLQSPLFTIALHSRWDKPQYALAFNQTQEYLYKGDSYQINLTQEWTGQLNPDRPANRRPDTQSYSKLVDYLPTLFKKTQSPFSGYLGIESLEADGVKHNTNQFDFELLSCSPELFVVFSKKDDAHHILTKPIKGTRPRGDTPDRDAKLKNDLENSEKDRAENVMIVDLLRNDLGKYAQTGSVKVPKLFAIESFSNVHHMVSSITATIKDDIHPLTVLFGSLPAGSITGTPKKRAVEIIDELEQAPRGAYCGSMGYMNFDGTGQWNVLIRSLQANKDGKVSLWAGGGITVSSQCDEEYQECLDKVNNLFQGLSTSN